VCGRFTLTAAPDAVAGAFELDEEPRLEPRFNIAPGQGVATIHQSSEGARVFALRRWGLVPRWARDPKIGSRLINARSETVAEKPAFRDAFRRRRCLVPADGFFEWAAAGSGPRQPWYIGLRGRSCFGIAGLYESWEDPEGQRIDSCVLLTTDANERLRPIHARMPVILAPEDFTRWLDPGLSEPTQLAGLLRAYPDEAMELRPVSRRVNRPEHDDAACIAPIDAAASS
jgi:putative SOS response-associated peptidase YedK